MYAQELRNLQAPIKARYKENSESAKLTMETSGVLLHDRSACRVESRFGPVDAVLHPAAGGDGTDVCSIDMMLQAIVACAGVTFNLVATARSLPFDSVNVVVEGDGDFRGALGIAKDVPVGVTAIRMRFEIDSPATDDQLAMVLRQTGRCCVVFQTLRSPRPSKCACSASAHEPVGMRRHRRRQRPGGATVAREMACRGKKVLILEWVPDGEVRGTAAQYFSQSMMPGKSLLLTPELVGMVHGITTGGSSLFYYGTHRQPLRLRLLGHPGSLGAGSDLDPGGTRQEPRPTSGGSPVITGSGRITDEALRRGRRRRASPSTRCCSR